LSTTLLQIENEFYGTIRPKRRIISGERPLHALADRGVEYVEVRCIDVDPFSPIGIDAAMMRFLDIFLLHCLLSDSPPDDPEELVRVARNQHRAAQYGREPGELLIRGDARVPLVEWAAQLLAECEPIASALDAAHHSSDYGKALASARAALANPASTPSARVLKEMAAKHDNVFKSFALAQSRRHRDTHLRARLSDEVKARYETMAKDSLASQRIIEHADTESFEAFLKNYLAPEALGVELA
jgi:glutamate--cysteine ligase